MIQSLIYLVIIGFILGLLFWLVDWMGTPAPINKVLKAVILLVGVIILINFLLQLAGQPGFIKFKAGINGEPIAFVHTISSPSDPHS